MPRAPAAAPALPTTCGPVPHISRRLRVIRRRTRPCGYVCLKHIACLGRAGVERWRLRVERLWCGAGTGAGARGGPGGLRRGRRGARHPGRPWRGSDTPPGVNIFTPTFWGLAPVFDGEAPTWLQDPRAGAVAAGIEYNGRIAGRILAGGGCRASAFLRACVQTGGRPRSCRNRPRHVFPLYIFFECEVGLRGRPSIGSKARCVYLRLWKVPISGACQSRYTVVKIEQRTPETSRSRPAACPSWRAATRSMFSSSAPPGFSVELLPSLQCGAQARVLHRLCIARPVVCRAHEERASRVRYPRARRRMRHPRKAVSHAHQPRLPTAAACA